MLYVSRTGCQWRYLPEWFGPWTREVLMQTRVRVVSIVRGEGWTAWPTTTSRCSGVIQ